MVVPRLSSWLMVHCSLLLDLGGNGGWMLRGLACRFLGTILYLAIVQMLALVLVFLMTMYDLLCRRLCGRVLARLVYPVAKIANLLREDGAC